MKTAQQQSQHNPNHGRTYIVKYAPNNGVVCTFVMKYNRYEFRTPYSQAFHEASMRCLDLGIEKPITLVAYPADEAFVSISSINMALSPN